MTDSQRLITIIAYAIVLLILISLSFLFSSADMAYGSVNLLRFDSELKRKPGNKTILRAMNLATHYDSTIATILFMNDTVNAGLDSVSTLLGVNLAYLLLADKVPDIAASAEQVGLAMSLCVLLFKITFGEIVPKSISKPKNYKMSLAYSGIIQSVHYLFLPITYPVSMLGKGIASLFKKNVDDVKITDDDLHEMIDDIEEQGSVDEDKAELLHETINYTTTVAEEVMTPRVDVYAIDIDDDLEEICSDHQLYRHSRVPVYENTIDNVIGYIQTRTLMTKRLSGEEFTLRDILLEPLRVPQSAEINDILRTFKKDKQHFALVMDEYGGLDGILTMEDILEEIVGEIWDEKDSGKEPVVERKDGSYILDGSVTIEDFCDLFELNFEEVNSEYLTLGGLIVELLDDHFAKVGDEVEFENVHLKVIAIDDNGAVNKVIAKKNEEEK